jgi:hypothetical protein
MALVAWSLQRTTTQDHPTQFLDCVQGPAVKHPVAVCTHDGHLAQPDAMFLLQLREGDAVMALSKAISENPIHRSEIELADLTHELSGGR